MPASRRIFLSALLGAATTACLGQGMDRHRTAATPRPRFSGLPFDARFTDVSAQAGLRAPVISGGPGQARYILETIGCGCAFIDFDNDGWMDIFLLSGTRLDDPPAGAGNRLYKNNRDGTFTDVTEKAGLARSGWAFGVCAGDYNNDGFDDLFITCWGQNVLYRNNGDGTFTDVTRQAGLAQPGTRWGSGCAFLDYNRDGHLDLFVSNYLGFDLKTAPQPGQTSDCQYLGHPVLCGPHGFPYGHHSLFRNNGDGTFTDVSEASHIASAKSSYGFTALVADFDDDGWPDIYVACDSTPSLLFMNNHDGTFREEGAFRGVAFGEDGEDQSGMGAACGDYDGDGRLDIFKTNFADDVSNLYRNLGKGQFEDDTRAAGLGVENRFVTWGAGMVDLDNNGLPDLFAVTGNVYPGIGKLSPGHPFKSPRLLFRNLGKGRFEELFADHAGPALADPHCSRGCAFGDFDNDGDLDILIVNLNEPPSLLRNDLSGKNNWLKVKLIGTRSNRGSIGARVVVSAAGATWTQEVQSQSSFLSCNDPRLHFGLGKVTRAKLRVRWPSGDWQELPEVAANQLVTVREGAGIIPTIGWHKEP